MARRYLLFFFFNDTATTEIYTLSLHDALPIWWVRRQAVLRLRHRRPRRDRRAPRPDRHPTRGQGLRQPVRLPQRDRKSTRLNSSHANISYAVFCLKKKKNNNDTHVKIKNKVVN